MDRYPLSYLQKWEDIRYVELSSIVLLYYDYFLTLDVEIRYVWQTPLTFLKVLYIVSRYITFIDTFINAWREFNWVATDVQCLLYYRATVWLSLIGLGACEILLTLRICAVYEMKRMVIYPLSALFVSLCVTEIILVYFWLQTVIANAMSEYPHLTGCILYTDSKKFHTIWILLLVYDTVLFAMISLKGRTVAFRSSTVGMRLSTVVYRDGKQARFAMPVRPLTDLQACFVLHAAISLLNVVLLDKITYLGPIST
ncbi:hypothetical protein CVT24_007921 [Panaeolus cyanescens]|uniref:DUF6533 domain-containing protein n=1 Tax=Panaeolus cyanescens TaxID=181874 RepID=A0A409W0B6_9AGAR|nr:hypothetical protein CVT24_007921 [Panaeolus cyanescens]